ncbi:MAG TPA: methylenetetrahydrofolate reductase [Bacteroidales bacterium]
MANKVSEILAASKSTRFSFELLPPLKGRSIDDIYKAIDPLMEFNPININITYHQHETVYNTLPDGSLEKKIVRKRPGNVALSAAIKFKYDVTVIPHLICGGHTKDDIEDLLLDFHFLGINNLLVLRGDAPKGQKVFIPEKNGHEHTSDLVKQVMNMNKGIYVDPAIKDPQPTNFSVGVAGYPEKHVEAPNMETDLKHLKEKVDAGADYIVTQLFFDNAKFFAFEKACRLLGITVPIIPGIKPLSTLNDIKLVPQIFSCDIPQAFYKELEKCKTNTDVKQVGIEWAIYQSKELKAHNVPAIHFYTYGISDNVQQIARATF